MLSKSSVCFNVYLNDLSLIAEVVREELFKEMADLLVSEGYKDVGYDFISLDDCWSAKNRTADGKLYSDPDRFPSGVKSLADYVR